MKPVVTWVFMCGASLFVSSSALAVTYYVHPSGADSNEGTLAAPWLTVAKAFQTAAAGDAVNFAPGSYSPPGATTPTNNGTSNSNRIYYLADTTCSQAWSSCTAGAVTITPRTSSGPNIYLYKARYITITGFTIQLGSATSGYGTTGIEIQGDSSSPPSNYAAFNTIQGNTFVTTTGTMDRIAVDLGSLTTDNTVIYNTINFTATSSSSTAKFKAVTSSYASANIAARHTVQYNVVTLKYCNSSSRSFEFLGGDGHKISGNYITYDTCSASLGIAVSNMTNLTLDGNSSFTVNGSGYAYSIRITDSNGVVANQNFIDSGAKSIIINDSSNVTLNDTTIRNSRYWGLVINDGTTGTTANISINRITVTNSTDTTLTTSRRGIQVNGATNVTVTDFSLIDNGLTSGSRYGFEVTGSSHTVNLTRCSIQSTSTTSTATSNFGIWFQNTGATASSQASTITGCTVTGSANPIELRQRYMTVSSVKVTSPSIANTNGISLINGAGDITLKGIESYSNTARGIRIDPTAAATGPIKILNSYIHHNAYEGIQLNYNTGAATNIVHEIKDNYINDNQRAGIWASKTSNVTISGNVIVDNNLSVTSYTETYCINYSGGASSSTTSRATHGIVLYGETRVEPTICGGTGGGAGFVNSSVIERNVIARRSSTALTGNAIWLYGGQNNIFRRNQILNGGSVGLLIESEPRFASSPYAGVPRDATGNLIESNLIAGHGYSGIILYWASGNTITNNVITKNGLDTGAANYRRTGITKLTWRYGDTQGQQKLFSSGDIVNNLIYGNAVTGIWIEPGSGGVIRQNTIHAQGGSGILTESYTQGCTNGSACGTSANEGTPVYTLTLRNNSFSNNGGYGAYNYWDTTTGGGTGFTVSSCINNGFYSNTSGTCSSCGTCTGDVTTDPKYISPAGPDGVLGYSSSVPLAALDDNFRLSQVSGDPNYPAASGLVDTGSAAATATSEQVTFEGATRLLSTLSTRTDGTADTSTVDIGYHAAAISTSGTVSLTNYTGGQGTCCANQFSSWSTKTVNGAKLLGFELGNTAAGDAWVYRIVVRMTDRIGLIGSAWASAQILMDTNGDGTPETSVGGYGQVYMDNATSRSSGAITFEAPIRIPNGTSKFWLVADFPGLMPLESVRMSISTADITLGAPSTFTGSATVTGNLHAFQGTTATGGTRGLYYDGVNLDTLTGMRVDSTIDLPAASTPASDAYGMAGLGTAWSARWYGAFYADCDGDFTLYADPEGSVRLETDWSVDFDLGETTAEQSAVMRGIKVGWHPFVLTYKESGAAGSSQMELRYSATCGSISKQIIPVGKLATISNPNKIGAKPAFYFTCASATAAGYEVTDRTIAVNVSTNVLTTARLYYRVKTPAGSWISTVTSTVPSTTHTLVATGLAAGETYETNVVVTDLNGESTVTAGTDSDATTSPFCEIVTSGAASWCAGTARLKTTPTAGGSTWSKLLTSGPSFGLTPGNFPTGPDLSLFDDFYADVGVDPPTTLNDNSTAIFSPSANPCTYYVTHDNGLILKVGSMDNTYSSAGTDSVTVSAAGFTPWYMRVTETTGLASFSVTRLCSWRGDTTPQPIPANEWGTYCGGSASLAVTGGADTVRNTYATFKEWVNYGFLRVDYGTSAGSLTKCAGRCAGTTVNTEFINGWNYVTIRDLAPSTQYYFKLTEVHKTGATSAGSVDTLTTAAEPTYSTGGLEGTYYSDMTLSTSVTSRTDSTVDFSEESGVWPPSGVPADSFSARWAGEVKIPDACDQQPVTFIVSARDGVALWVDNDQAEPPAILDWTVQSVVVERSVTLTMGKGWHRITLKMFHYTGANPNGGRARLEWVANSGASSGCISAMPRAVIPSSALSTGSGGTESTPPNISATCASAPSGQVCTTSSELTVDAGPSCTSPASMAAPTTTVSDTSTPVTTCWGPTAAGSCTSSSGWPSSFTAGTSLVRYLAIDSVGNVADASVSVRVVDYSPPAAPTVTLSPGVSVGAGSPKVIANPSGCDLAFQATSGNATVIARNYFDASATDNCGVSSITSPGSTAVPVGSSSTVSWRAVDTSGNNSAWTSKTLCARDVVAPTIALPSAASASCTSDVTKVTLTAPTVADDNDPDPVWKWELPDSGAVWDCDAGSQPLGYVTGAPSLCARFGFGTSQIRVRAVDWTSAATVSSNFNVNVTDTTAPAVAFVSQVPTLSPTNGANVVTTWSVSDICFGVGNPGVTVSHAGDGGATWNDAGTYVVTTADQGGHTITLTAIDTQGNVATAARSFVIDRTGPTLLANGSLTSTEVSAPDWFFFTGPEPAPTYSASDAVWPPASNINVLMDIWKNGIAAPDAGHNVVVALTNVASASGAMCANYSPESICVSHPAFGLAWDVSRLRTIGNYELWASVSDVVGNIASTSSFAVDGGPRTARRYYLKVARLAQAIDEAVSVMNSLPLVGSVGAARISAGSMQRAWAWDKGYRREESGDAPPYILTDTWGRSWDAGDRPWEGIAGGARKTALLDQGRLDPRKGLRYRMFETVLDSLAGYFAHVSSVSQDAALTAAERSAAWRTVKLLARGAIAELGFYREYLDKEFADAGGTKSARWSDFMSEAFRQQVTVTARVQASNIGDNLSALRRYLERAYEAVSKVEYEYDVPFATNQFATDLATGKKKLPSQIAVETNTTKARWMWDRMRSEETSYKNIDASIPAGVDHARRFVGEAPPGSGLVEQAWPPLRRDAYDEVLAYNASTQYTVATAGANFDGVFAPAYLKPDAGPSGWSYHPPGADAGQYMRFSKIDAITDVIDKFRFCRRDSHCPEGDGGGGACFLFDPAQPLNVGLPDQACDPNITGSGGMLHGYLPALILNDAGSYIVNPANTSGRDIWTCPASGWCSGSAALGYYRPSPLQYAGAIFAQAELAKRALNAASGEGRGVSTLAAGLVYAVTERIFSIVAPAAALLCPADLSNANGSCDGDDAGAAEITAMCVNYGGARCVRKLQMRNTLSAAWGTSLRSVAACYDTTILDCPEDGGVGNCIQNELSPVPLCPAGVTEISTCAVEACNPAGGFSVLDSNMCNFQHVVNLAYQYPIKNSAEAYYRIPRFPGYAGCDPTIGNEPLPPSGLAASAGNTRVALSWLAPSGGASSYNIYRGTTSGVTRFSGADAGTATSTSFTNTGLSNGTTYYYVVTAVNDAGESVESFEVSALPAPYWTVQFGTTVSDSISGIGVDTAGNIFAYGQTNGALHGTNAGGTDIFVRKHLPDGGLAWGVQLGSSSADEAAAYAAAVDPSGNVIVAGRTNGVVVTGESGRIFLLKYDTNGALVWGRQFQGSGSDDAPRGLAVDNAGDIYIAGFSNGGIDGTTSAGGNDPMLVKYSSAGARQWTRLIGTSGSSEYAYAVAVAANGDPVITGFTTGNLQTGVTLGGPNDIFVARFNSSGTEQWRRQYGTSTYDYGIGIAVSGAADAIYVSGFTLGALNSQTSAGNFDGVLLKLASDGTLAWTRQFGTASADYAQWVTGTASGDVFVTGYTGGNFDAGVYGGGEDIFVARYDPSGNRVWVRQDGTSLNDAPSNPVLDPSGNLFVGGHTYGSLDGNLHNGSTSYLDAFIMRFSAAGAKQ